MTRLNTALNQIIPKSPQDSGRLAPLADYVKTQLNAFGLDNVRGGSGGELQIGGFARSKDWDVAYDFAGKPRLLISLKSIWKNASGTVPNRLDDLMGEAANIQQMSPEVVIGYVLLFDRQADAIRKEDGLLWSAFFQQRIQRLCIRKAPMWNQGLIEGCWFICFDSALAPGEMVINPEQSQQTGAKFFTEMLAELMLREPAVPRQKSTGGFVL